MSALITKLKNKINHQRKTAISNQTNKQTNKHLNKSSNKKHQKSGHLMLMVLFLLVILTMFVTSLYALSLMNVKESIIYHEKNQAYLVAKSGAETVIDQLALLSNNELNHKFQENNPQTIEGDIAGGHYTATIMKYGKQIMIDVQSTYKRTTSSSLTQMVDVNRYGIVYVENGNIEIASSDNKEIKLTADIAQYNNSYRGLKISGKGEIDGNIYTRSKVDIDSLKGKLELGSIYTDQQVDMDVSQNCKIYFNGLYTSCGASRDIFQKDTDSSTNGAEIIGNELQRGDNNIGDHPNFLKIRTARNIISLRYTDKFGYIEFPGPQKNEAVFVTQAFQTPYENYQIIGNDISWNNSGPRTSAHVYSGTSYKKYNVSALLDKTQTLITGNQERIEINMDIGENILIPNLEAADLRIIGNGTGKIITKNITIKTNKYDCGNLEISGNSSLQIENMELSLLNLKIKDNGKLNIVRNPGNTKTKDIYIYQNLEISNQGQIIGKTIDIQSGNEENLEVNMYIQQNLNMTDKAQLIKKGNLYIGRALTLKGNSNLNNEGEIKANRNYNSDKCTIIGSKLESNEFKCRNLEIINYTPTQSEISNGKLEEKNGEMIFKSDLKVMNELKLAGTKQKPATLKYNGNDETNIIVANQIDINNGTIKANGIKMTNNRSYDDFEIKGTSDIDLGQNLVSQNLNIGENSHVSGKGLYINELKTQGKIKFEEIRNINVSSHSIYGGQVEISGKGYVETNDIIANNLIIKDTAYVKAMAISVENDFKLQNGAELDMMIYEDLTDINSKNSYSNIIWMDKN